MSELSPALADADNYVKLTRRKKALELELKGIKTQLETAQQKVLDHMEEGRLPESFRQDGASVFTAPRSGPQPRTGITSPSPRSCESLGWSSTFPRT